MRFFFDFGDKNTIRKHWNNIKTLKTKLEVKQNLKKLKRRATYIETQKKTKN